MLLGGLGYLTLHHAWFWVVLAGVGGAVFGSFLNCALYRLPRGISLRRPAHSFCPACGHKLQIPDLIPLLSWLWLRGRCRYCGGRIGAASLWLETGTTLAAAASAWAALHF